MSNVPSIRDAEFPAESPDDRTPALPEFVRSATASLRVAGFWSAVLLPFVYVPVLVGGVVGQWTVAALLAVHAVALVAGHGYRSE